MPTISTVALHGLTGHPLTLTAAADGPPGITLVTGHHDGDRELIRSSRSAARFEGMFLGKAEVRALLHEPEFQVFDNPDAFLTCNKDPAKALCDPDRATRGPTDNRPPSLDRCQPACANIARTDQHIAHARHQVTRLQGEVADPLTPVPLRTRLEQRIAVLTAMIRRHQ